MISHATHGLRGSVHSLAHAALRLPLGLVLGSAAAADSLPEPAVLLALSDSFEGVGEVIEFVDVAVDDGGSWAVLCAVDTGAPAPARAVVAGGAVVLPPGLEVQGGGGTLASYDRLSYVAKLAATAAVFQVPGPDPSALAVNDLVLRQRGDEISDPTAEPGTTYAAFRDLHLNGARQILLQARLDPPGSPTVDALVRLDFDEESGVTAEEILLTDGDLVPGIGSPVEIGFFSKPYFDFNDSGDWLAKVDPSPTGKIVFNGEVLVQPGDTEPVTGLSWSGLETVAVNNLGQTAFYGQIGIRDAIAVDGQEVVSQGTPIPELGLTVSAIGTIITEPYLRLSDEGDVLWYGTAGTGLEAESGIFLGDRVVTLDAVPHRGYDMSDSGEFVIVNEGNVVQLFRLAPALVPMSTCQAPLGLLTHEAGILQGGSTLVLALDESQDAISFPFLFASTEPSPLWPPCGTPLPGLGDLLIDLTPPNPVLTQAGDVFTGAPALFEVPLPQGLTPFCLPATFQGAFVAPGSLEEPVRLTNGLTAAVP